MRRWFRSRPITVRITTGVVCAMAVLLLLTGGFVYERMQFALDRSIRDVPSSDARELDARRRHRDEALRELLAQLGVAYGGTLLIAGLVGYRTARAALNPVERMRDQASAGASEPAFRLSVPETQDELSRLATTLNGLLAELQESAARERRLLSDASHELRTPLAHLQMEIDLALSRERSPEELRAALERLRSETARLTHLANDLLLIARADGGALRLRLEPVPVSRLVEESCARFAETARAGGRPLEAHIDQGLVVEADPDRLARALDNLIENALRHGSGPIRVEAVSLARTVSIHVRDEGRGFPDGFAERAFDRFAAAAEGRESEGAGLGLAIVDAIVAAHGGTVGAGNGTHGADVWLELPALG